MQFILSAIGSGGDVHPVCGLALRLSQRGHGVTVIALSKFGQVLQRLGLDHVLLLDDEYLERLIEHPDIWHLRRGPELLMRRLVAPTLRDIYAAIEQRHKPGETVLVAHPLDFASRSARDKLQLPLASLHLAPATVRSAAAPPRQPGLPPLDWMPQFTLRGLYRYLDHVADGWIAPEINEHRAELGLPPVKRVFDRWWYSPDRVIGLFPPWFASPAPDWPPAWKQTGFPLWDDPEGDHNIPDDLEDFLQDGQPPLVFTPGTGNTQGQQFFAAAVEACRSLNRRGILLTAFPEQLPADLPPGVRHFEYLPFSRVLSRTAGIAHHGGIGTLSQSLAAGVPQLIMPMTYDQPDNAARLKKMGVAKVISPRQFQSASVAAAWDWLLDSDSVRAACADYAQRLRGQDAIGQTCDLLEQLRQRG